MVSISTCTFEASLSDKLLFQILHSLSPSLFLYAYLPFFLPPSSNFVLTGSQLISHHAYLYNCMSIFGTLYYSFLFTMSTAHSCKDYVEAKFRQLQLTWQSYCFAFMCTPQGSTKAMIQTLLLEVPISLYIAVRSPISTSLFVTSTAVIVRFSTL